MSKMMKVKDEPIVSKPKDEPNDEPVSSTEPTKRSNSP